MAEQPRVEPLEASDVFPHEQSARPALDGVVSRQDALELGPMETGLENGEPVEEMPVEVDEALLERGAQQFDIFCVPCHDAVGTGNGAVVQRGYPQPPSFHEQRLRDAPDGHFFDVITNGFGHMYSYAPQVDRPLGHHRPHPPLAGKPAGGGVVRVASNLREFTRIIFPFALIRVNSMQILDDSNGK